VRGNIGPAAAQHEGTRDERELPGSHMSCADGALASLMTTVHNAIANTATCLQQCLETLTEDLRSQLCSGQQQQVVPQRRRELFFRLRAWAAATARSKVRILEFATSGANALRQNGVISFDEQLLEWFATQLAHVQPEDRNGSSIVSPPETHHLAALFVLVEALRSWIQVQTKLVNLQRTGQHTKKRVQELETLEEWYEWWRSKGLAALWRIVSEAFLKLLYGLASERGLLEFPASNLRSTAEAHLGMRLWLISVLERMMLLWMEVFLQNTVDPEVEISDTDSSTESEQSIHLPPSGWPEALALYSVRLVQGVGAVFAFASREASRSSPSLSSSLPTPSSPYLNLALTTMEATRILSRLHCTCWASPEQAKQFLISLMRALFKSTDPALRTTSAVTFEEVARDALHFDVMRLVVRSHGLDAVCLAMEQIAAGEVSSPSGLWMALCHCGSAWMESPDVVNALVAADLQEAEQTDERMVDLVDGFLNMWDSTLWHASQRQAARTFTDESPGRPQQAAARGLDSIPEVAPDHEHYAGFFLDCTYQIIESFLLSFLPRYVSALVARQCPPTLDWFPESQCSARLAVVASLLRWATRPRLAAETSGSGAPILPHGLQLVGILERLVNQTLAHWQEAANSTSTPAGVLLVLLLTLLGELIGDENLHDMDASASMHVPADVMLQTCASLGIEHWRPWLEAVLHPPVRMLAAVAQQAPALATCASGTRSDVDLAVMATLFDTLRRWSVITGPGPDPQAAVHRLCANWLLPAETAVHLRSLLASNRFVELLGFSDEAQTSWRFLWLDRIRQTLDTVCVLHATNGAAAAALNLLLQASRSWPSPASLAAETAWWEQLVALALPPQEEPWCERGYPWRPSELIRLGECLGWAATKLLAVDEVHTMGPLSLWSACVTWWLQWIHPRVATLSNGNAIDHVRSGMAGAVSLSPRDVSQVEERALHTLCLLRGLSRVLQRISMPDIVDPMDILAIAQQALCTFFAISRSCSGVLRAVFYWLADLVRARVLSLQRLLEALGEPLFQTALETWLEPMARADRWCTPSSDFAGSVVDHTTENLISWLAFWRAICDRCPVPASQRYVRSGSAPHAAGASSGALAPAVYQRLWQMGLGQFLTLLHRADALWQILQVPCLQSELAAAIAAAAWLSIPYDTCLSVHDRNELRNVLYVLLTRAHSASVVSSAAEAVADIWTHREASAYRISEAVLNPPDGVPKSAADDLDSERDAWIRFVPVVLQLLLTAFGSFRTQEALEDALFHMLRGMRCPPAVLHAQFMLVDWFAVRAALLEPIGTDQHLECSAGGAANAVATERVARCCRLASEALCAVGCRDPHDATNGTSVQACFRREWRRWLQALRVQVFLEQVAET